MPESEANKGRITMEEIVLYASKREVIGKKVKTVRGEGGIPAIIYGQGMQPIPITLNYREASRIIPFITSSQLVVIEIDGERHTTLIRERQRHPVKDILLHTDFMVVSMTEKLRTDIVIILVGEAPAVKEFNGALVTGQESLEVECLPQYLPDRISVDISMLNEIGDTIYTRDIELPPEIEVLTSPDEMVVLVASQVVEEEPEEELEEEIEEGEPEVVDRGKKEEEEEIS